MLRCLYCFKLKSDVRRKAVLEGAVSEWNKENPTKAVQPGDRVAASALKAIFMIFCAVSARQT